MHKVESEYLGYKGLIVWQVADLLVKEVYLVSQKFPKAEIYGLTSQLRRAILSIALNIVEGYARNSKNEFRQFLRIALGSLAEAEYLIEFAFGQNYMTQKEMNQILDLKKRCGQLLWKLYKSQF